MKLNADLGESFGNWQHHTDADVMPLIDMANIACGYHAGDARTMQTTISLAKSFNVDIGAHPAYPDLQGFGRRSMRIPRGELSPMIQSQIAVLEGMARCQGVSLQYVKPHGALYNDMMSQPEVFEDVLHAVSHYHQKYPLVVQALADNSMHIDIAKKYQVALIFEAFCDRQYEASGLLKPRREPGAVLNAVDSIAQAKLLIDQQKVNTSSKYPITIKADTICVHGDNPEAMAVVEAVRQYLDGK